MKHVFPRVHVISPYHLYFLDHLLDLESEQAEEGELEEADDAEADDEEGVGGAGEPAGHRAEAPGVVVPGGADGRGVPERGERR